MVRAEVRQAVHVPQHYEVPQQRQCVEMSYAEAVRRLPACITSSVVHPAQQMEVGFSPRSPAFIAEARPRKSGALPSRGCPWVLAECSSSATW
ncbi:hypothetical protein MTO96_032614 [Rhipicephalus appendiculatus]